MIFGVKSVIDTDVKVKKQKEMEMVKQIFTKVGNSSEIKFIKALKASNDGTTPLVVNVGNKEARNVLLKTSKGLRNINGFEKIFISPDLTEAQRHELKTLIKDRNAKNEKRTNEEKESFYFGIRGSRIIQIWLKERPRTTTSGDGEGN